MLLLGLIMAALGRCLFSSWSRVFEESFWAKATVGIGTAELTESTESQYEET